MLGTVSAASAPGADWTRIEPDEEARKMTKTLLRFCGVLLAAECCYAQECADPQATTETRAILKYLQGLSKNGNRERVVSGNTLGLSGPLCSQVTGHQAGNAYYELKVWSEQVSGRFPAIVCGWPDMYSRDHWTEVDKGQISYEFNPLLIRHWKQGGLVMIEPVFANPYGALNPKRSSSRKSQMTDAEMDALFDPTKPVHEVFCRQLDAHARGLRELADAGVVVLYHPFVEGWGGHFWWGRKGKRFAKLWRFQFDYLSKTKGLHNLIWVCDAFGDMYPGDKYLDIYAPHAYGHSSFPNVSLAQAWEHDIRRGGIRNSKYPHPIMIGECGARAPRVDWNALEMLALLKKLPRVIAYQNWSDSKLTLIGARNTYKMINDPLILNRGELTVRGGKPHTSPVRLPDRSHILESWEWYTRVDGNNIKQTPPGDGWTPLKPMHKRMFQVGSALIGRVTGPAAGFASPDKIDVEIGPGVGIEIALVNLTTAETLQVYFTTQTDREWDNARRLSCSITAQDEFDIYDQRYRVYRLSGAETPGWKGKLKQVRVRLGPKATDGWLRVDHIRLVTLDKQ
jgi:mannan endo-1,4-beta-mannosidase